jgi:signal peptidase
MKPSELLKYLFAGLIIAAIVALLVTQLIGQPFIIFVETGSMEPTLQANDGFLAVPSFLAGDPEPGDVILFEAQELGGGGLTTHRVVRETSEGYITKGDANPFVDQDGDEPPVAEGQIKSVGLQFGGELVVIPGLGATIGGITGTLESILDTALGFVGLESPGVSAFSTGVLVVGLVWFVYSLSRGSVDRRARDRSRGSLLRNGVVIIAILTLVVVIPVNFSMLLPSGVYQIEIVSSVEPTADERIIGNGQTDDVTYFMQNGGILPAMVYLEPAGPGVRTPSGYTYVPRQTTINSSVQIQAPDETGRYLRFVREHRYLVVLPPSLIDAAHDVHPLAAIGLINVTVAAVVILVSIGAVGTGRVRLRSRRREIPIEDAIKRRLPPLSIGQNSPSRPATTRDETFNWANRQEATVPDIPEVSPAAGIEASLEDDDLSGRQLIEVYSALQGPPAASGLDANRWSAALVQEFLADAYGVSYSDEAARQLLAQSRRADT